MALSFYHSVARQLFVAGAEPWDWEVDDIRIMIVRDAYPFSAAHNFRDDISDEVSGTNYDAGGKSLLGLNKTATAVSNTVVLTSNDVVIAQHATGFADGKEYVLVKHTGGAPSTDPLLCHGIAAGAFGNVAGALTLDVPASFITLSV